MQGFVVEGIGGEHTLLQRLCCQQGRSSGTCLVEVADQT